MTELIPRFISNLIGLLGLSFFGFMVAEVLKKWQLIDKSFSSVWVIVPILIIFVVKKVTGSPYIRNNSILSPNIVHASAVIINIILIILGILAIISIPFLWFGVIEETAKNASWGK
jgi:hypothetical protein